MVGHTFEDSILDIALEMPTILLFKYGSRDYFINQRVISYLWTNLLAEDS